MRARHSRVAGAAAVEIALLLVYVAAALAEPAGHRHRPEYQCPGSSDAVAALQSDANVKVHHSPGIGYGFLGPAGALPSFLGGPNVTRGVVIMPENGVAPEAYAPLARGITCLP
jgi:hypothetical protein